MTSEQSNLSGNQFSKKSSKDAPEISEYGRRRNCEQGLSQSYFTTLTAFTIAATCLVSSAAAFTPAKANISPLDNNAFFTPTSPGTRSTSLRPFGFNVKSASVSVPITQLFSSAHSSTDPGESDVEEWRALLAAFQMYRAAYGDLKVPTRFVVPSMAPWPEAAWGMKLGFRVGQIRATGKFVGNNQSRRDKLDTLGFVWRARAETMSSVGNPEISFDQIYDALVTYRNVFKPRGDITVPPQFIVPDTDPWPENTRELPLGQCMAKLRTKSFLKKNPGAEEKLAAIGFQMDKKTAAHDVRFQNVYDGLKRYKEIYGDLLVPQPFVVPNKSAEWPEEAWNLRLGARVNAIRSQGTFVNNSPDRKEMLDELGFVWSPPESERRKRGRKSKEEKEQMEKEAMEAVSQEGGSPKLDSGDDAQDEVVDVESLMSSFDFSATSGDSSGEESIAPTWGFEGGRELPELVTAAQEEAAQQAAQDEYKPPLNLEESLAEAKLRAIEVGVVEEGEGKTLIKGKQKKQIPWFNDDFGDEFVFDDVVEALTLYKSFYGDFSNFTTDEFVIPVKGEKMISFEDVDDFGMLDDASARAEAAVARFEEMDDLAMTEDLLEAEISRLQKDVEEQDASVATAITDVEADWPEHLEGMGLGNIVSRIRDGSLEVKHLPERKAQLDAIDFDWGDPKHFIDVPFEKAMCAMYGYYLVRGDLFVPPDFVMPDEDPWPQALAGYEIGKAVSRIRQLQNFLEAYHTEKVSLLRSIDFVWFPTLSLPLDPNDAEMTPEMLLLSALGHPDYERMSEIPMGLPDKIIADGPFFESDDPKQWWRRWHNWDYVEDYWYQQGRRDNALWLRLQGYPQMADEHEEKYGPGLFKQIEATLERLDSDTPVEAKEKGELMGKLKYYQEELAGCTDIFPPQLEELLERIDTHILQLMTGKKSDSLDEQLVAAAEMETTYEDEEVEDEEYEYEYEETEEEKTKEEKTEEEKTEEKESDDVEEEDYDFEEDLGLDSTGET